jgi:hypothetical protein
MKAEQPPQPLPPKENIMAKHTTKKSSKLTAAQVIEQPDTVEVARFSGASMRVYRRGGKFLCVWFTHNVPTSFTTHDTYEQAMPLAWLAKK